MNIVELIAAKKQSNATTAAKHYRQLLTKLATVAGPTTQDADDLLAGATAAGRGARLEQDIVDAKRLAEIAPVVGQYEERQAAYVAAIAEVHKHGTFVASEHKRLADEHDQLEKTAGKAIGQRDAAYILKNEAAAIEARLIAKPSETQTANAG